MTDTFDIDSVLRAGQDLAQKYDVAGVVPWRDQDVVPAAALAQHLGLPGNRLDAAKIVRNKYLMRQALRGKPHLLPRFARVRTWSETVAAAKKIGFPAIIKPTVAMGSMGVFEVRSVQELAKAHQTLITYAREETHPVFAAAPGELIYEEYLGGSEHSVEGYVYNKQTTIAGITDKKTMPPFHLEVRHVFPTSLPESAQGEAVALVREVVEACGLDNCAFHLECKFDQGRIRLIEVGARVAGDYITSHLLPLAVQEPFYENVLRVCTGAPPLRRTDDGTAPLFAGVTKIVAKREGVFAGFAGLAEALTVPDVEHVTVERSVGGMILLPPRDYVGCILGSIIACSHSSSELTRRLDQAAAAIAPTWHDQDGPTLAPPGSGNANKTGHGE